MLGDDSVAATREAALEAELDCYRSAYASIESDPNNELVVAILDDRVVGVFQMTYIPNLTYKGAWRAMIEGVRVHRDYRSRGVGRQMMLYAQDRARSRSCEIVQLTCDKRRRQALRFYRELGFASTHKGFKLFC